MSSVEVGDDFMRAVVHFSDRGVTGVELHRGCPRSPGEDPFGGARCIEAFFSGGTAPAPTMDLSLTEFQERAYSHLVKVPYGEVITYGELARRVGSAPRAIGRAMASNPVPIIYPCHRIVACNGIGGFGNDVGMKEYMLGLERRNRDRHP
jgi:methylated-DNA-[protein]-cysteine S-methyltransferase